MTEAVKCRIKSSSAIRLQSGVYPVMAGAVIAMAFSSIFVTKLEALGVPAVVIAFYRVALATVLLTPAALFLKGRELIGLRRGDIESLGVAGFCLAVHFGAWIASLEYIPIATSLVLVDSHPILVAIASHFILGEPTSRRTLAGAAIGVIGTAVICKDGLWGVRVALAGDGLALLGALALVGYLLVGRRIRSRVSLLAYATPVYAACSLFLLVWAGAAGLPLWNYGKIEWVYFTALAVIPTIMGHTVLNWALRHLPATGISISFLGEPVVAAALAFLFLSQRPPVATVIGGGLVLAGIYLTLSRGQEALR